MYFICVQNDFVPPSDGKHRHYQLTKPNYLEFVRPAFERSRTKVTELHMMRQIVEKIAMEAYSDELYRPNPPYVDYEGLRVQSPEELEAIVAKIVNKYCPNALFYFLTKKIKQIPTDVEIVYFYGTYSESDALLKSGVGHLSGPEARKYMYEAKDEEDQNSGPEGPLPQSMPTGRLPSQHSYENQDQIKKAKRKKAGEFQDGTRYNQSMLIRADEETE